MGQRRHTVVALLLGLGCSSPLVQVHVSGAGVVRVQGELCRSPGCALRLSLPAVAAAEPASGQRVATWGGQCAGSEPTCLVRRTDDVWVSFEPNVLELSVSGPGSVLAEDAQRVCESSGSPCVWSGLDPQRLVPRPREGAVFVGFQGACSGTGACVEAHGRVRATFEPVPNTLLIDFVGGGGGVVRTADDGVRCTHSCAVPFPPGSRLELLATPDTRTFFDGFEAPCTPFSCVVREAGTVRVRFEAGRWLGVALAGNGGGRVAWNGDAVCPGTCGVLARADAGVSLALEPNDSSYLGAVEPPCAARDAGLCVVPSDATQVAVRFESALRWSRAFEVRSLEPYDATQSYFEAQRELPAVTTPSVVWVALEQREFIEIDGVERPRPPPPGQGTGTGLLISLSLDAGRTVGVVSLENPDGSSGGGDVRSLQEVPDAGVLAFIRCGNVLQGQPCATGAVALLLDEAGVVARQQLGTAAGTEAWGAGLDLLGRPLVTLRRLVAPGSADNGLYQLAPDLSAPPVPVFRDARLLGFCGQTPRGTLCGVSTRGSPGWCGLPQVGATDFEDALVQIDATGCRPFSFLTTPLSTIGTPTTGLSRNGRFPLFWSHASAADYGALGSVDAGALTVHWYGLDGGIEAVRSGGPWQAAAEPAGAWFAIQVGASRGTSLTGTYTAGQPFLGHPTGERGFVIGRWDRARRELKNVWFVAGEVLARNATLSADERGVMFVFIGRNVRFAGRALAADPLRPYHHVLFFDEP